MLGVRPGVPFGREWLCALLWPDAPEAQARTSLRQAVGHLRKVLGEGALVSSVDSIHLEPLLAWTDTAELGRLMVRPPGEREPMVELWRGELMHGFPAIEQPFTDWLAEERARLLENAAARLEECLAALSAASETERALSIGSRLVELEPTRESAHRAVMRLHVARGEPAAALRQYERCRELLERRLGIAPSAETEQLRVAIARARSEIPVTGQRERTAVDLDGRIPLAVLPFTAAAGDSDASLLASGLTEDVTTELFRFRELALIARGSVAAAAERGASAEVAGRETGARLVLSGSVRIAAGRARVTAALTDVATGLELWSERWDAPHDDPFAVLDRLTRSVVGALALRIDEARLGAARRRPRERLEAYECWLRGLECLRRGTAASDEEARGFFEQALGIAPGFARAYAGISLSHFNDWSCQAWDRWDERERLSFENARRAVELDDSDHVTHTILARIHVYRREFELGARHLEHALELNSNDTNMLMHAAITFAQLGEGRRASELADSALRLNPKRPDWYYAAAAFARFMARDLEESVRLGLSAPDGLVDTRAFLAAAAAELGDDSVARDHAARFVEHFRRKIAPDREPEPGEPVRWLMRVNPLKQQRDTEYLLQALGRAGLTG